MNFKFPQLKYIYSSLFLIGLFLFLPVFVYGATYYWIAGTGNWNDKTDGTNYDHWSASSGGAKQANLPGSADTVIFNSSSGGGTCTVNTTVSIAVFSMATGNTTTVTLGANLTTSGNLTVTAGTLDSASYKATVGGTFSVTGIIKVGGALFSDSFSKTPTLSAGSTVNYSALGNQTVSTTPTYVNLAISGSGTKTFAGAYTAVSCAVTITGGTLVQATGGALSLKSITLTSGAFTGSNAAITLSFNLTTSAGTTFTSTSNVLTTYTGLSVATDTFIHNSGTVKIFGGQDVTANNTEFWNFIFDRYSGVAGYPEYIVIKDSFTILNNLLVQDTEGDGGIEVRGEASPTITVNGNLSFPNYAWDDVYLGSTTAGVNLTINLKGNFSILDTYARMYANIIFSGTGDQTITKSAGGISTGTWTVNRPSETAGTAVKLAQAFADRPVTITAGTFDLAGFNFTTNGITAQNGGTLKLKGAETVGVTPTLNAGSTVQYYGTAGPYNLKGWTYSNIRFSSASATTYNLIAGGLSVKNLTIDANNTLDATASNYNTTLTGNWSNSGTFTQRTGTVTFSGTSQKVFGNTTFYNFTKDVSAGSADTMMFENTKTQTIAQSGTLTLKGGLGKILTLRSCDSSGTQSDGTQWLLTVNNTGTTLAVDYVDVKDSNASGGKEIAATNSLDSANNLNWSGLTSANTAPSATTASVSPSSVVVGATLTFTGNWTESDAGDQDKIYICKDSACTNCDNTAQSNCWCYSSSYVTEPTVTGTCTYTAQSADTGNRNFWLKVCDDSPSCSSSVYGGSFSVGPSASSAFKVRGGFNFKIKGGNDNKSFRIKCL